MPKRRWCILTDISAPVTAHLLLPSTMRSMDWHGLACPLLDDVHRWLNGLHWRRPPFTIPCNIVLGGASFQQTWPNHDCLRRLIVYIWDGNWSINLLPLKQLRLRFEQVAFRLVVQFVCFCLMPACNCFCFLTYRLRWLNDRLSVSIIVVDLSKTASCCHSAACLSSVCIGYANRGHLLLIGNHPPRSIKSVVFFSRQANVIS